MGSARTATRVAIFCVMVTLTPLLSAGSAGIVRAAVPWHKSPAALTLTAADVQNVTGKTFANSGTDVTNSLVSAIENVKLSTMNRYRVSGYQTTFVRKTLSGVALVQDSVGLYRSSSGAAWEYRIFTGQNKPPKGSTPISTAGIGNQARGYTTAAGTASVYFRRGVYTARVDIIGHGVDLAKIEVALSQVLDGRMKKG